MPDAVTRRRNVLRFRFECGECDHTYTTWPRMQRHLENNPEHAPFFYGVVKVFREGGEESNV